VKILIAEDERVSRRLLELTLTGWGHEVTVTEQGEEAWAILEQEDPPSLAILDWMMPGMDGIEICRRARQRKNTSHTYIILLTAKNSKANIVEGLIAGANDYVTKPFDRDELRARLHVGETVLDLQGRLTGRVIELEEALGAGACASAHPPDLFLLQACSR
jgi:DNA-binding response OmpR family regulator